MDEAASSDEQRFSIALNVDKDNDIFSSSNVINAFCNENKDIIRAGLRNLGAWAKNNLVAPFYKKNVADF